MTDFSPPARIQDLLPPLRGLLHDALIPLERQLFTEGFAAVQPALDALRERVRREGWWLPQVSADHGGMGLTLLEFAYVSELLGQSPIGHYAFNCQAPDAGNMEILLEYATPSQRAAFLDPLLAGQTRSCFGMTEPEFAGSNPTQLGTTATLEGDMWRIEGHKWFTTGADGAALRRHLAPHVGRASVRSRRRRRRGRGGRGRRRRSRCQRRRRRRRRRARARSRRD